jgi:hypothetical protein
MESCAHCGNPGIRCAKCDTCEVCTDVTYRPLTDTYECVDCLDPSGLREETIE